MDPNTYEFVIAKLDDDPFVTNFLLPLLEFSDRPYQSFLRYVHAKFGIAEFSASDSRFVLKRLENTAQQHLESALTSEPAGTILKRSLVQSGFADFAAILEVHEGRLSGPPTAFPSIQLELTHDSDLPAFGQTQNYSRFRFAVCKVNLAGGGVVPYRVLFHECGHAIHFLSVKTKYQSLAQHMPRFLTEGVAQLFESFVVDDIWLAEQTNLTKVARKEVARVHAMQSLYVLRENVAFSVVTRLLDALTASQSGFEGDLDFYIPTIAKRILYPSGNAVGTRYFYLDRFINHDYHPAWTNATEEVIRAQWLLQNLSCLAAGDPIGSVYSDKCASRLGGILSSATWESVESLTRHISWYSLRERSEWLIRE